MIVRKVDETNDWQFGKGASDYARDEQAIDQNIKSRLLSWIGDCFFAVAEGVDWKNRLDNGQQAILEEEIKSVILQSFGVVAVNTVSVVFDGGPRLFTVTYDVQTIFSQSFQSVLNQSAGQGS